MSVFPDTGPGDDGRRTEDQWLAAMSEDTALLTMQVMQTTTGRLKRLTDGMTDTERREFIALRIAIALKEARRLTSDLYRYADEVHGIDRNTIERQGPL